MKRIFLLPVFLSFVTHSLIAKKDPFLKCLNKKLDNIASIVEMKEVEGFEKVYDIRLIQPIDHKDKTAGSFEQRVFVYHKSRKKPVVFVTEGYDIRNRVYELTNILDANQISVEFRFCGQSKIEGEPWQYLTNDQAIEDLHAIRIAFADIYKKEWIATGISKGGTTTMIYKSIYPNDVDASVNYVGPLALAQEDKRMDEHILNVGDPACREKLHDFQVEALTRRDNLLPKVDSLAEADKMSFSIGTGAAFEFAVLEYTFSFWQFAHDCDKVPAKDASDGEYFDYLNTIVGFNFYSDATYEYFKPAFYQFMTENGYYGFIHDHVKHLLVDLKRPGNQIFAPKGENIDFNEDYMAGVKNRLDKIGSKMIHIQGAYDPWGAVGYVPPPGQDALYISKPKTGHTVKIKDLSQESQAKIYQKLDEWLKAKLHKLPGA